MADELKPDRNAINEDPMQDVDNNEGDDRATKNEPRSVKVLVIDHTNYKMIDDERKHTRSKESSWVVTPNVTEKKRPIALNLIGVKVDQSIIQTRFLPFMVKNKNS